MGATAWVTAEECQEAAAEIQQILDKYSGPGRQKSRAGVRAVRLFAALAVSAQPAKPDG
jgi:hypothetical protein